MITEKKKNYFGLFVDSTNPIIVASITNYLELCGQCNISGSSSSVLAHTVSSENWSPKVTARFSNANRSLA